MQKSKMAVWEALQIAVKRRDTKFPEIPVSLERNTEVFPHHFL